MDSTSSHNNIESNNDSMEYEDFPDGTHEQDVHTEVKKNDPNQSKDKHSLLESTKQSKEEENDSVKTDDHPGISNDSHNHDNCTLTQAKGSSDDNSTPSCSNVRFYEAKSKVGKRHYRKKSDELEDIDNKDVKKSKYDRTSSNDEACDFDSSSTSAAEPESEVTEELLEEYYGTESDERRSSSEKVDDSNEWTTVSDDDLDTSLPSVLKKEKPKPKWFVVPNLLNREIGNNNFFDRQCYGSLHIVQRLRLTEKLEAHDGCVNALNFNEAGNLLASASDDTKVVIWNWAIRKAKHVYDTGHTMNIFDVKFLPINDGSLVVTCSGDGNVRLLDLRADSHQGLATHRQEARRIAVHHDDPFEVLSVGDDGKILVIDIREQKPKKLLTVREGRSATSLYAIDINPRHSNEFCVAGRSQWVKIYDRRRATDPIQQRSPQHLPSENKTAYVTSAVYNYDGSEIVASYNDDDIYLFDTVLGNPNGDYAHKYEGHRNSATVKSVNFFGPKSEFIVSGSDCGHIFFWDKNTEAIVQWMEGDDQGVVNRLEPHPNMPILATSGLDHDVKIWMPSSHYPPQMDELEDCVKSNQKNRADEITNEPDAYDSQVLMFFLRSMRQYGQRNSDSRSRILSRNYLFDEDSDSSSNSPSDNSDSESDDGHEGPQCAPS